MQSFREIENPGILDEDKERDKFALRMSRMAEDMQRDHRPRKVLGFRSPHEVFFGVKMRYTKHH